VSTPARSTGRPVRIVRACRVVMVALAIIPNAFFGILNALAGQTAVFMSVAALLFSVGVVAFQAAAIRRMEARAGQHYPLAEPVLRRIAHRPRRIMTPADYKRLREMETELGWEPSEAPATAAAPAQPARSFAEQARAVEDFNRLTAAGSVSMASLLSGTGSLPAKATWDDVTYASEASAHFAQLARVGREFCVSHCPICSHRIHEIAAGSSRWPDLERDRAGGFTPDDIALMRSGALFGTDATVTLPSGKRMTGNEIRRWVEWDQAQRWLETERRDDQ
jgi:hypothetical protein